MPDGTEITQQAATMATLQYDYQELYLTPVFDVIPPPNPAPPQVPIIIGLNPSSAPHNADVSVTITGLRLSAGSTVEIGSAFGLIPDSITPPNSLSVTFKAINIALSGTLPVVVMNSLGQSSNLLNFTVT